MHRYGKILFYAATTIFISFYPCTTIFILLYAKTIIYILLYTNTTIFILLYTGTTIGALPVLLNNQIVAISVGVNSMTPPPAVPALFVWQLPEQVEDQSVLAHFHPGNLCSISFSVSL